MSTTPTRPARLLTSDDLAELLGVELRTIERWRKSGKGPPFMLFGRTVRYHPTRVQQWMVSREQGGPSSSRGATSNTRGVPAGTGGTRGR
ncbi:helix-turn-helix domain-containing protein [Brachybacterium sp. YJGR34]|uniref:helix-turn-helix domain-containing protein n=1 Tax=Brachybacterium sp. YJGR34 TaxID=2059911 RepID=UPI000E0C0C1B|nr:helix-turn-helix domain-containing protein [Brachybacterium sp. YJGR34]